MWLFAAINNIVRLEDKLRHRQCRIPKSNASKGERAISAILDRHGIAYETQYELGYYVHSDFAVRYNDKLFLIEYDGRQHYHPVKYFGGRWAYFLQRLRDTAEKWECRSRNLPLLRVRYDLPFDQIEPLVLNFLNNNSKKQ